MKSNEQQPMPDYEPPKVEFVEVEIEQGFAASTTVGGWDDGGNLGNDEI